VRYHRDGGDVTITFNQIRQFVLFDLENVFFTLGITILKQINGIPMGSPTSPALAITVCAHSEYVFHQSIMDFPRFFAVRYMDDVHATCVYRLSDIAERQRAQEIFIALESIYPSSLTLECTGEGSTDFLETSISYPSLPCSLSDLANPASNSARSFSTRHLVKNKNSLAQPALAFSRLQHSSSYRAQSQVRGALIGSFLRLPCQSSSTISAFASSLEFLAELHHLSYSPTLLSQTLRTLSFKHPNPLWPLLLSLLSLSSYSDIMSSLCATML